MNYHPYCDVLLEKDWFLLPCVPDAFPDAVQEGYYIAIAIVIMQRSKPNAGTCSAKDVSGHQLCRRYWTCARDRQRRVYAGAEC